MEDEQTETYTWNLVPGTWYLVPGIYIRGDEKPVVLVWTVEPNRRRTQTEARAARSTCTLIKAMNFPALQPTVSRQVIYQIPGVSQVIMYRL